MDIKLLTDDGLTKLMADSKEHIEWYASNFPSKSYDTFTYPNFYCDAKDYPTLELPNPEKSAAEEDYEKAKILYEFFSENKFPLSLLFDARYQAYLTHFVYWDYMKARWPIGPEKGIGTVKARYFIDKGPKSRPGILGLFWPVYLIDHANVKNNTKDDKEARIRYYFCGNRIVRDKIVEHAYATNPDLFVAIIDNLRNGGDSEIKKKVYSEAYSCLITNALSVLSLDIMEPQQLQDILNEQILAAKNIDYNSLTIVEDSEEEED